MADQFTADEVRVLKALAAGLLGATRATGSALGDGGVASDSDLDSMYGNEKIRMNPRDWTGRSHKNTMMNTADPEFLDMYAETMAYFAGKNDDAKKAGYDRKAAARARGWAARIRGGWKAPATRAAAFGDGGGFGDSPDHFDTGSGGFGTEPVGEPIDASFDNEEIPF